jgi:23S rRNA pseudouridine1911/1915/1917 synthase
MKSPPARPAPRPPNRRPPAAPATPPAPLPERGAFAAPANVTLAAALRAQFPSQSWSALRRLCISGKISVAGRIEIDPAARLSGGESIEWRMASRDARRADRPSVRLVHEDVHLVVIEKPEGVSTVPFEKKESGTALDLIRDAWRQKGRKATVTPLYVVHRIDKDTSGLLVFAKTKLGERGLHTVFKQHLADREYLAVAQGHVRPGRIESRLIPDRGDGIRGSTRSTTEGQLSITHVAIEEQLPQATLCRIRLETGRTHQIRIHLSEDGHPLVGETVYVRDLLRAGGTPLPSPRLLLHATTLAFDHPVTGERLAFECPLPEDYLRVLEGLR